MKEENKKFLKETFNIDVDMYDSKALEKVLELVEAETIKNLYKIEKENKVLKDEINKMLNEMTY